MKNWWRRETAGVSTRANGESERTCVEPSSSPERVYGCMGMEGCGVVVRRADQEGMGRSSAIVRGSLRCPHELLANTWEMALLEVAYHTLVRGRRRRSVHREGKRVTAVVGRTSGECVLARTSGSK